MIRNIIHLSFALILTATQVAYASEISDKIRLRLSIPKKYQVYFNHDTPLMLGTGQFGFQYPSHGPIAEFIFSDIETACQTKEKPLKFLINGGGHGPLAFDIFEHTNHVKIGVNDLKHLGPLSKVIASYQDQKEEAAQAFSKSIQLLPGNCFDLRNSAPYNNLKSKGFNAASALNLIHYFTPSKIVEFFARMSEDLLVGAKFYVTHDCNPGIGLSEIQEKFMQNLFSEKKCHLFQEMLQAGDENNKSTIKEMAINILNIRTKQLSKFMTDNKIPFPFYINTNLMGQKVNLGVPSLSFEPNPDLIEQVATATQFKIVQIGGYRQNVYSTKFEFEKCKPEEADKMYYVLEKQASTSTNASRFRDSKAFQSLVAKAKQADEARRKLATTTTFTPVDYYPFMEIKPKK